MRAKGFGPLFQFKPRRNFRRGYLPFGRGPGALYAFVGARP